MGLSQKGKRLATLFVHGPDAGDWEQCAADAGYANPPPRDHKGINEQIEKEQNAVDGISSAEKAAALDGLDASDWKELADRNMLRLEQIAQGIIQARPAEVQALKEIMLRGHGKAGMSEDKEQRTDAVIVLPAFGFGQDAHIEKTVCPNCGEVIYDPEGLDA